MHAVAITTSPTARETTRPTAGEAAGRRHFRGLLAVLLFLVAAAGPVAGPAEARDIAVTNDAELAAALRDARRGDAVVLASGTYRGDIYVENLEGVTIRSADLARRAVIAGGSRGMQLVAPQDVTLQGLVFSRPQKNGLIIDDAASRDRPARGILIEGVTVENIVERGNNDGIKLAGIADVVIRNVVVESWGTEGSGIDFVGVHGALVEGAFLRHLGIGAGGSGIRVKGGSKAITIRANRVELAAGRGRAIQAGGHTSPEFFRFADGDRDYEAAGVAMEGNVVIGGASAFSFVNIDGAIAHRNLVVRPGTWVMRILNENQGTSIVATRNGRFDDNRVVFEAGRGFNSIVNVGEGTHAETFGFARNSWLNLADPTPAGSRVRLPVQESGGIYGAGPAPSADWAQVWEMPWGWWVVNATAGTATIDLSTAAGARVAVQGRGARFMPTAATPLAGPWTFSSPGPRLTIGPMSQAILVRETR